MWCQIINQSIFKSLHSVINQVYKNLEIIVIDGNSGKTTTEILKNIIIKLICGLVRMIRNVACLE